MPHFKCEPCRIRFTTAGSPARFDAGNCPECDAPVMRVAELSSILGFRAGALAPLASDEDGIPLPIAVAVALPVPPTWGP